MDRLTGIPVKVDPTFVGAKRAVLADGVIHVSPAMYELMRHAEPSELEQLLRAIPLLNLDLMPFPHPLRCEISL